MTDTDLITAGDSTDSETPSNSVTTDSSTSRSQRHGSDGSLSTMVLPELRALANRAGVKGTSGMRKNELIAAIRESQGHRPPTAYPPAVAPEPRRAPKHRLPKGNKAIRQPRHRAGNDVARRGTPDRPPEKNRIGTAQAAQGRRRPQGERQPLTKPKAAEQADRPPRPTSATPTRAATRAATSKARAASRLAVARTSKTTTATAVGPAWTPVPRPRSQASRRTVRRDGGGGGETELREDDVVQPVAGILDVLDNYAFVRTSGYLAGPHDVYVSMNMVRKNGLRRGDAVTGAVRVPKDGEQPNQRQKFNPLVRLDTVNGGPVEDARKRPDFTKLTPLYPNQRLRLETTPDRLTTRVIDLIMPIGKGQRALIVSPPKAGKTTIMQDIANAITRNNPECHLMVVLVDERPEEVTDMQRSVKGEVIASTFDRPPSDHTQVAELAIERAKRLVEQGKDVVVLLDSITRLGRAYNNASPASGRILSGGVDSTALYPPKRFLGAARNIEEGGSLTIIATAMVETGSTGDTVIFEEFKGTGNAELKLDRKISERRVFPAVDVNPSGTRKDELLLSPDEFSVVHKLRRVLSGLDSHQAIDLLMSQLRKTKTNYEFLVQVSKTTPGNMDND